MNQRPDFRRNDSYGSDTSSVYSRSPGSLGSAADSAYSVWSSSESDSFVWRDDPWGFYGVGGAVTRYVDERDDKRRRFAAHFLSGPFAQFYKKSRSSSSPNARSGRSAGNSRSSSRSSTSSARGHNNHHHFRPPSVEPQFHQDQFPPQEPFHPHHNNYGPPPPPPPPPAAAPAGFEGGFIQLGGPGGPPPPPGHHAADPWDNDAAYRPGAQIY